MILFYSDHCPHCRMLLDTIHRRDVDRQIKLVSIEALKARGTTLPPQIAAVPTLVLLPSKQTLVGKEVFDYLLLPGRGCLLNEQAGAPNEPGQAPDMLANSSTGPGGSASEPAAHILGGGIMSDAFSAIDSSDTGVGIGDRPYTWSTLQDGPVDDAPSAAQSTAAQPTAPSEPFQMETRTKKELPDMDAIRTQREMELR